MQTIHQDSHFGLRTGCGLGDYFHSRHISVEFNIAFNTTKRWMGVGVGRGVGGRGRDGGRG